MNFCRQVGDGIWLALTRDDAAGPGPVSLRHQRDRAASARAEALAVRALGLAPEACAASRAHTQGTGASLVAPAPAQLGVDLVSLERVTPRHATSILGVREWNALAPYASIRPALAWALKEAAAKASGEPLRFFPAGVVLEAVPGGLVARLVKQGTLATGWLGFGDLLCAWVVRPLQDPPGSSDPDLRGHEHGNEARGLTRPMTR